MTPSSRTAGWASVALLRRLGLSRSCLCSPLRAVDADQEWARDRVRQPGLTRRFRPREPVVEARVLHPAVRARLRPEELQRERIGVEVTRRAVRGAIVLM